ncbi:MULTISPECIES: hypothetical protein [Asticcacaulis]|uniref:hypothetical protein n=1 Tax=Asticcacaulis TaxID=76890 RepID=UPI001AE5B9B2|nr:MULTISPECIES: hypothetical protein [Asticcacaulis]MBP2159365.1 hypothetical protein [Asticcacaulis solisilvae]MDR6800410.1 hypothetical protein [Asticcacaulis sp. BE141]
MPLSAFQHGHADFAALMTDVFIAAPSDRAHQFATLREAMTPYLEELGAGKPPRDTAHFVATARTYLRALSTYPSDYAEWLEVFRAFQQLFNAYQTARSARPAEPVMTRVPNSRAWRT